MTTTDHLRLCCAGGGPAGGPFPCADIPLGAAHFAPESVLDEPVGPPAAAASAAAVGQAGGHGSQVHRHRGRHAQTYCQRAARPGLLVRPCRPSHQCHTAVIPPCIY